MNEAMLRDITSAISICHNVTPIINDNNMKEYQASSPDEVALVQIVERLGLTLE